MKWIHLGYEYFACVDDDDYDKVKNYVWRYHSKSYARTHQIEKNGIDVLLHHFLVGKSPDHEVDHINRAPWDNRKQNLRVVYSWENLQNKGIPVNPPFPLENEMIEAKLQRARLKDSQNYLSDAAKKNQNWRKREAKRIFQKVIDENGNIFSSAKEAASYYGAPYSSNILACCRGAKPSAYGKKWRFAD